ncbi:hypothetical protein, partial [Campylobacter fetus]
MKKTLIIIPMILGINLYAGVWSSSGEDGIIEAFSEYDNIIQQTNQEIISKYNSISDSVIEDILANDALKKQLLTNHTELLKEYSLDIMSLKFEIEKLK